MQLPQNFSLWIPLWKIRQFFCLAVRIKLIKVILLQFIPFWVLHISKEHESLRKAANFKMHYRIGRLVSFYRWKQYSFWLN